MDIKKNLAEIRNDLRTAKLVAVTKTVSVEIVRKLKSLGVDSFGENRVKEAEARMIGVDAEWHMIGHLQSNKVKLAVELFDMIQSIDSIKIAEKINDECEKIRKKMPILLQVNIANEPQKQGFSAEEIEDALTTISKLGNVDIEGFMMIAPLVEPEMTRPYFKRMKQIFDRYKERYNLKWLSMGMTNDYKIAIEEGANMVRIGRRLFE